MNCGKLVKGCKGLAMAALGIGRAEPEIIAQRRDACRTCDRATRNPSPRYVAAMGLTTLSRCQECGCFIAAKSMIAGETCPLGKWPESRTA